MTWPLLIFTYLVTWCITLFTVLPVRSIPTVRAKLLWNTGLAAVVTLFIYFLLKSGWIPLRRAI